MPLGKPVLLASLLLAAASGVLWSQDSQMEQRWRQQAMQSAAPSTTFDLGNKKFSQSSAVSAKTFATSQAGLLKEFKTEAFDSKTYPNPKTADVVKETFKTQTSPVQDARFSSKKSALSDHPFTTRDYTQQSKTLAGSDRSVPAPKASIEGKTDGYWKAFKERLDKDLSMEEVRELLNKTK